MKTTFKKIAAFTAATLITAALAVPVFADDSSWLEDPLENPIADSADPSFNKTLTIYNEMELDGVYVPHVTYTYSVSEVDPNGAAEITDKDGYKAIVKKGVQGGFALKNTTDGKATITFGTTDETVNLENEDTNKGLYYGVATEKVGVVYDLEQFTEAGVYRYKLTETSSDFDEYGVTRATAGEITRYVDVYVKKNEAGDGYEVYGTVMFNGTDNTDLDISSIKTDGFTDDGNNTGEEKDGTYDPEEEIERDPSRCDGDELYTYNYLVKKDVVNSMLGNEKFPFTVSVTNANAKTYVQKFKYSTAEDCKTSTDALADAAEADNNGVVNTPDAAVNLGDENYLALVAVPANVNISVSELNDEAAMYDVTAKDTTKGDINLAKDEKKVTIDTTDANNKAGFYEALALTNYDLSKVNSVPTASLTLTTFTNEMHSISPTGLLFTVAPFAAMAGLGAGMIVLFSKNKKRDDAENII